MKSLIMLAGALVGAFVVVGCGSSEASATKKEEDSFRNPPHEMPQAAKDAMAKSGVGGPPPEAKPPTGK